MIWRIPTSCHGHDHGNTWRIWHDMTHSHVMSMTHHSHVHDAHRVFPCACVSRVVMHVIHTGWRRHLGCLKLQVSFCKRATIYRALLRKWPMKIRRPMTLRHPVLPCACVSRVGETYKRDFCMCGKRQTQETCVCVKTDIQKRETYLYTKYPEDRPSRCITYTCEKRRFYKCEKSHSKETSVYKVPARSSESMHHLIHAKETSVNVKRDIQKRPLCTKYPEHRLSRCITWYPLLESFFAAYRYVAYLLIAAARCDRADTMLATGV